MQAKSLAYRLDKAISIYKEVIKELQEISVSDQEKEERQNLTKATHDKMEIAIQEIKDFKLDKDSDVNEHDEITFLRSEFSKLSIEIERKNKRILELETKLMEIIEVGSQPKKGVHFSSPSAPPREEKQIPSLENQLIDEEEENENNVDTNDFHIEEDVAKTHEEDILSKIDLKQINFNADYYKTLNNSIYNQSFGNHTFGNFNQTSPRTFVQDVGYNFKQSNKNNNNLQQENQYLNEKNKGILKTIEYTNSNNYNIDNNFLSS